MPRNDVTIFEDLSNELFIEIFEYLIAEDLFIVFSNLQRRINQLLKDPYLLRHIAAKKLSYIQSLYDANHIRFVTVRGGDTATLSTDLQSCSIMPNACQLHLDRVFVPDLILGLSSIQSLMSNLVHISINAYNPSSSSASNNVNFIIERLLALPHLRTLALKFDFYVTHILLVRLLTIRRIPMLESFSVIGCSLSLLSVIDLMKNASRLNSLQVQIKRHDELPDYSVFKQLIRGKLELIEFDDIHLKKLFRSMVNVVRLRLDDDTLASIKRLSILPPRCLDRLPIGFFSSSERVK